MLLAAEVAKRAVMPDGHVMVADGNDDRGIDVALMTGANYEIASVCRRCGWRRSTSGCAMTARRTSRSSAERPRIPLRRAAHHHGLRASRRQNCARAGGRRDVPEATTGTSTASTSSAVRRWSASPRDHQSTACDPRSFWKATRPHDEIGNRCAARSVAGTAHEAGVRCDGTSGRSVRCAAPSRQREGTVHSYYKREL